MGFRENNQLTVNILKGNLGAFLKSGAERVEFGSRVINHEETKTLRFIS